MLDESSIIQNEGAKRSKFVLGLHPDNVILLSGTPTAGKYEKLWSQLHLLGWGISKDLFYKQYVTTEWMEDSQSGFRIKVVTGYKNVDRLKAKLAQHGAVFMKSEDVFTLPEQSFISVTSKIPGCYKKFMRDDVITIDGREYVGDTTLSKRIYARMMCSFLNRERVAAFVDLVHSTEDRLIVFYNFNEELNTMLEALTTYTGEMERPCSIINGEKNDLTAYDQYENSITFIQYQAGSMGVNLQKANKIIYFSLTDRSELFEQSKKRIHRIGQTQPCFYYQMICPGTVEEDILEALKMRKDYTDELFKAYQRRTIANRIITSWVIIALIFSVVGFAIGAVSHSSKPKTETLIYGRAADGKIFDGDMSVSYESEDTLFVPLGVPLDSDVQEFIYYLSKGYNMDFTFVMAIIQQESGYQPDAVSNTDDYGLMQINKVNHGYITDEIGVTNYLDPYENVRAGMFILRKLFEKYETPEKVLMAYNLGESGAKALWDKGVFETNYSKSVQRIQSELNNMKG